jgi:lipid-A-disaccharide synthase
LASVFGDAVALLAKRSGALEVVVPAVPRLAEAVAVATASWPVPAQIVTEPAAKDAAFRGARAALTKSGTSTLELAVAGVPMVAAYRVSLLEEMIARAFIKVPSVILANLVLGENVVPEFIQRACTPEALAGALLPLMGDTPERAQQLAAFARLDGLMGIGQASPSDRAAAVVLDCAARLNQPKDESVVLVSPTA